MADDALRDTIASTVRAAFSARCSICHRPPASDEDWSTIPEGEGGHLCWEPEQCGFHELLPMEQVVADALLSGPLATLVDLPRQVHDLADELGSLPGLHERKYVADRLRALTHDPMYRSVPMDAP